MLLVNWYVKRFKTNVQFSIYTVAQLSIEILKLPINGTLQGAYKYLFKRSFFCAILCK